MLAFNNFTYPDRKEVINSEKYWLYSSTIVNWEVRGKIPMAKEVRKKLIGLIPGAKRFLQKGFQE